MFRLSKTHRFQGLTTATCTPYGFEEPILPCKSWEAYMTCYDISKNFVARAGLFSRCTLAKVTTRKCWPGIRDYPLIMHTEFLAMYQAAGLHVQSHMPRPRRRYPVPLGMSVGRQEFLIDPIQQPRLLFTARLGLEFAAIAQTFHVSSPLHILLSHDPPLRESFLCTQEKSSI